MNKRLLGITSLIVSGIIALGFYVSKTNEEDSSSISKKEKGDNTTVVDEKKWEDITKFKIPDGEKIDYSTNAKDWIATENSVFNEPSDQDSKLQEAGFDEYYKYYLEARVIPNNLSIIKVKGISIEKDFNNIEKLAAIIVEEYGKRTESREAPTEKLIQASNYLRQLFNDLNVAINKGGVGEIFGVAYQVDGKGTKELEAFLQTNN